ncbi:MAG TPA: response regulator transcription factor [Vicinamibacteria bacterium]|nr:response regulator transcription factor [Vicinamibacteria bacterium]
MKARVLIVEDEPVLVMTLTDRLKAEGYEVESAETGDLGLKRGLEGSFDLILLDVALPGRNGFDLLRDLRQQRVDTPVVMLTARGQVVDRVLGLKLGADDYLPKPFDTMELLARVEAVLRRRRGAPATAAGTYVFGEVRVDLRRAEVRRSGEPVELSSLEFKLLRYFIEHQGDLLSRRDLLEHVWGYPAVLQTRTVDVHVASLRQKLERHPAKPEHIVTVHRMGYRFVG